MRKKGKRFLFIIMFSLIPLFTLADIGKYQIVAANHQDLSGVWILNTQNGELKYCWRYELDEPILEKYVKVRCSLPSEKFDENHEMN